MNKTKIEWTNYTFNPVIGCKNNCSYCYARKMNNRFKWIPKWEEPKFFEDKLNGPYRIKKPSKIFVCSIADLFGDWVPYWWIESVLNVVKTCPQHTFQFLTKNPKRYLEFDFPKNCWLGITIDKRGIGETRLGWLKEKPNYKFISFEPLLEDMSRLNLSGIDLVIVGGLSGIKPFYPPQEWINNIVKECKKNNTKVFFKKNLYAKRSL